MLLAQVIIVVIICCVAVIEMATGLFSPNKRELLRTVSKVKTSTPTSTSLILFKLDVVVVLLNQIFLGPIVCTRRLYANSCHVLGLTPFVALVTQASLAVRMLNHHDATTS
jgi:hypothetical protein